MLQIHEISKKYTTGSLVQRALRCVSLDFRDSEFVSILGPSGSGKTTLLNIVGGLDRYDSGDLVINGISTKDYKDRDWDSYRNHSVGFVFQSYNLIPHQTALSNVELALTLSGIPKSERLSRAARALSKVGLGDQFYKKPNQMSGGQMQRVAIARALINDPDILLADEPTGALDTETSLQVMELLKEVAKDRLVIMVTHNAELAEKYSSRIVRLQDGKIISDSNPFTPDSEERSPKAPRNMGKSSMSFRTALSLSFNNLWTKKGRTLLTAFAGSMGIIGIALILALSTGVNAYIDDVQRETMGSYPITIEEQSVDLNNMMGGGRPLATAENAPPEHGLDAVYSNGTDLENSGKMKAKIAENNLTDFKKYLESPDNDIQQYLGENGIAYSYDVSFDAYAFDPDGVLVNTGGSTLTDSTAASPESETAGKPAESGTLGSMMLEQATGTATKGASGTSNASETFEELLSGSGGVSTSVRDSYDVVYGSWPENYDEVILILNENNEISLSALYALGLLPSSEYQSVVDTAEKTENFKASVHQWDYTDICEQVFYLLPACDYYQQTETGTFESVKNDPAAVTELAKNGTALKISGIIRPKEDADNTSLTGAVGYTKALTDYMISHTAQSPVVIQQQAAPESNVLNGMAFEPAPDVKNGSYEENMEAFGFVNPEAPSSISLYASSFENKDAIAACIERYNEEAEPENQIIYTDFVELLTASVTTIVNGISYVLIAFVAVSLVVSSLMIGIITYISVLERTKEIGILRAIGASKHNISEVFNAETIIIGLCSGLLGVGIAGLLLIPCNAVIQNLMGTASINASLPVSYAFVLILLSVLLTLLGGLLPSKKAARKDPVTALRTE